MPRITSLSFNHKGNRYTLEFDLNDAAIMDDKVAVDVVAKVTDEKGRELVRTLTVEVDFEKDRVRLLDRNKVLKEFDLGVLRKTLKDWDADGPLTQKDLNPDEFGDQVNAGLGDSVEALISSIPVPDPIFGCFIKAGISATIGQAITCYDKVRIEGQGRRARAIGRCLIDNAGGIFSRAVWRTLKCMGTLGFG